MYCDGSGKDLAEYGMFALIGLHLFLNGNWIGSVLKKGTSKNRI
ncbi:MAG: hypothetical protein N2509_07575 [Treponemataceae bacterium]|nr:hypothetical protein [Treponemataceae bacterium]